MKKKICPMSNRENFKKISCSFVCLCFILTVQSFVTTFAGTLWASFCTNTRFFVTQIWATNTSHCWTLTVLYTVWRTWCHLRWQWTITEICNYKIFLRKSKEILFEKKKPKKNEHKLHLLYSFMKCVLEWISKINQINNFNLQNETYLLLQSMR